MGSGPWGFKSPLAHSVFPLKDAYLEEPLKVDVETLSPTQKRVHVEVPSETVNEELQGLYKIVRKEARIPGFRPGRAPIRLIKARFKDYIRQEVLQALIPRAYEEVFRDAELEPLSMPEVEDLDTIEVEEHQPVRFAFTVEVKPEIDLPPYPEVLIDKQPVDVPREAVDEVIKQLQRQRAEYQPIDEDRPAQLGDFLSVDWEIRDGDETLDERRELRIELSEGSLLPELEKALVGMRVGEQKEVSVTFPQDHSDPTLAGQSVIFNVTLNEISKQLLPELDDAFAADLGFETYEQFHGKTWNDLIDVAKNNKRQEQVNEILAQLRERVSVTIPDEYLANQVEQLRDTYRRAYQREGRAIADLDSEEIRQRLREEAQERVQNAWILAKVMQEADLSVQAWEVDRATRHMAEHRGHHTDQHSQTLATSGRSQHNALQVATEKLYDHLIDNVGEKEPLIVAA